MEIISTGQITLVDLIDNATYIYYSANPDGSGATKVPESDSKYIGIYTGSYIAGGQPTIPPSSTTWSRYVGEKGEEGNGIIKTEISYGVSLDGKDYTTVVFWEDSIPNLNFGEYLWTRTTIYYKAGEPSISYSVSYQGKDANSYKIETSHQEIVKFYNDNKKQFFSPSVLTFYLYSLYGEDREKVNIDDYEYELSIIGINSSVSLPPNEFLKVRTENSSLGQKKVLDFEIENFINKNYVYIPREEESEPLSDEEKKYNFKEILLSSSSTLTLEIREKQSSKFLTNIFLLCSFGTSDDMAKFSVTAQGIEASVGSGKLSFDRSGLIIKNSGLTILDEFDNPLLQHTEDGLYIKGNGEFTGAVSANSGNIGGVFIDEEGNLIGGISYDSEGNITSYSYCFRSNGNLEANKGNIGGILISTDGLVGGYDESDNSFGFKLTKDGLIEANNIEIGANAKIANYLQLGENCFIYNTDITSNEYFIKASNFLTISKDGTLILKNEENGKTISLNGRKSSISGNNWNITPNQATFNNVTVKGTIKTAVFEKGKVSTISGLIMIRPSSSIVSAYKKEDEEKYVIYLKSKMPSNMKNHYCEILSQFYTVFDSVENEDGETEVLYLIKGIKKESELINLAEESLENYTILSPSFEDELIIDYGNNNDDKIAIGLNYSNNDAALPPCAISVIENTFDEEGYKQAKGRVVLGKMDGTYGGLTGYGLYADNVYLNGSLISEGKDYYSGINTSSNIYMPDTHFKESGPILFWAGAKKELDGSITDVSIQNAPFKVDTLGNMYAGSGYFEGSVISRATITAAEIQTAILTGWSDEKGVSQAALTIRAQDAIKIYGDSDANSPLTMELTNGKLNLSVPIWLNGTSKIEKDLITSSTFKVNENIQLFENGLKLSSYNLKTSENDFKINCNNSDLMEISPQGVHTNLSFSCKDTIILGEITRYQSVNGGYDLYIGE